MVLEEKRKILINKFFLRIEILLLSIILLICCIFCNAVNYDLLFNVFVSLFASSFIWGIGELFDLIFDTYNVYHNERNIFQRRYIEGLYSIRDYLKDCINIEKGQVVCNFNYYDIGMKFFYLRNDLVKSQENCYLYNLLYEIEDMIGYLDRLYLKFHGYTFKTSFGKYELSETEKTALNELLIKVSYEKEIIKEYVDEENKYNDLLEKEKMLELKFESCDNFFDDRYHKATGNLKSTYLMIPEQTWINIDFVPILDYYKKLEKIKLNNPFVLFFKILTKKM